MYMLLSILYNSDITTTYYNYYYYNNYYYYYYYYYHHYYYYHLYYQVRQGTITYLGYNLLSTMRLS